MKKLVLLIFLLFGVFNLNADCLSSFQYSWNAAQDEFDSNYASCQGKSNMARMLCMSEATVIRVNAEDEALLNYEICQFY